MITILPQSKKTHDLHPTSFLDIANIFALEIVEISFSVVAVQLVFRVVSMLPGSLELTISPPVALMTYQMVLPS
jgi:hypothetical protein